MIPGLTNVNKRYDGHLWRGQDTLATGDISVSDTSLDVSCLGHVIRTSREQAAYIHLP